MRLLLPPVIDSVHLAYCCSTTATSQHNLALQLRDALCSTALLITAGLVTSGWASLLLLLLLLLALPVLSVMPV
jgi:hypothetical protein